MQLARQWSTETLHRKSEIWKISDFHNMTLLSKKMPLKPSVHISNYFAPSSHASKVLMVLWRKKKGGGKSKWSWKNEPELYCAVCVGCKSCLQELLKWRNSYLLTLRSSLQSPNVSTMIYVTQSWQDSAWCNKIGACRKMVSVLKHK